MFVSCVPSMIKYIAGINHYGNRIRMTCKSNATATCPVYDENEGWDYGVLHEKNKKKEKKRRKNYKRKL